MNIQIINGPNLNLLGKREPHIYGNRSFESYFEEDLKKQFPNINLSYFQSNHEGDLIDKMQEVGYEYDGIVINPGAYTHTSIALADCAKAISSPVIEVHISDISTREDYRQISYIKESCIHSIMGLGLEGYAVAIRYLKKYHFEAN